MNPSPLLDSAAFPHIYERVVNYAPYEALLQLRRVNRASRLAADAILFKHVAIGVGDPLPGTESNLEERSSFAALSVSASSSTSTSEGQCFLPVSPLWGSATSHLHVGWKHTRALDIEAPNVRRIPALRAILPDLEIMRRRQAHPPSLPARTVVDLIQLPMLNRGNDRYVGHIRPITRAHPGVKRHVIVLYYDPAQDLSTHDLACPFWDVNVPCVIVFRAARTNVATTKGVVADASGSSAETFLDFFFRMVVDRTHVSYTLVGLEDVPPPILASVLGIDTDYLVPSPSSAEYISWTRLVRDRTIETLRAMPTDSTEFLEDDPDYHEDVAEVVEVLTMDEYRDRVGENVWELETFADKLPALSVS